MVKSQAIDSTSFMSEEQCAFQPRAKALISCFDNYKWHGQHLAHLSFFEYSMLVQTKNIHNVIAADFNFDIKHPKYSLCVQHLACKKSQVMIVTFNSQLSQFQAEEESVQRGHP